MKDLRTAAQQALEALESAEDQLAKPYSTDASKAIAALKAALAEPNHDYERGFVEGMSEQARRSVDHAVNAMAERKPLTDDEIAQVMYRADAIVTGPMQFRFARAIERAHGIGGEDGNANR